MLWIGANSWAQDHLKDGLSGQNSIVCKANTNFGERVVYKLRNVGLERASSESLHDQDRLLTMADVEKADPKRRDWLIEKVRDGKTICSVVSEASLENLGASVESGFRPSVPFVATAAAALMMAETVKALCHSARAYRQNLVIGNLLLGSAGVGFMDRSADEACVCVLHRTLIDKLQFERESGSSSKRNPKLVTPVE